MRKFLLCSLVLLVVICISSADATLLGLKDTIAGTYPDIHVNNVGRVTFTPNGDGNGGGALSFYAKPSTIAYSAAFADDDELDDTEFWVYWSLDSNGKLDLTKQHTMELTLNAGAQLTLGGHSYDNSGGATPLTLLSGSVLNFGWQNDSDGWGDYEMRFDSVSGDLVTDGIWSGDPNYETWIEGSGAGMTYEDPATHGYNTPESELGLLYTYKGWGSGEWWNSSTPFEMTKVKSDMAPVSVPEPATLILLGCGLTGFAAFAWRRRKKQG